MPITVSPLRYPGGKSKIYPLVQPIITHNLTGGDRIYVEPFAGGAGLALKLLYNHDVDQIILNDIDPNIYKFWLSCLTHADDLCEMIFQCPLTMDEWYKQRDIYSNPNNRSNIEVGFATFYLNRCNVSGIIRGGPIGGNGQNGTYGLDARFNRSDLIRKVQKIKEYSDQIKIYNNDAVDFLHVLERTYDPDKIFLNIDPPYVNKGPILYENSFDDQAHRALSVVIARLPFKWIVTYDKCDLIYNLYQNYRKEIITLNYSVGHTREGKELLIYSDNIDLSILKTVNI